MWLRHSKIEHTHEKWCLVFHAFSLHLNKKCLMNKSFIFHFQIFLRLFKWLNKSSVAQWKRAGLITQRSVDRNHSLLFFFRNLKIKIMIFQNTKNSEYSVQRCDFFMRANWCKCSTSSLYLLLLFFLKLLSFLNLE